MAQETLTAQTSSNAGAQINLQAVTTADGFKFPNTGRTLLVVNNDAGALALAFAIQTTVDGEAVDNKDVAVTASEEWTIGPFEVESACLEHEAVAEAAAVASPDERRGNVASNSRVLCEPLRTSPF